MRAAVLYQPGTRLEIKDIELLPPQRGEVRVRLAASGICHSDLHYIRGNVDTPVPIVLGHEGAGVVEEVGPGVTRAQPGDHVVLVWRAFCGRCFYCLRGQPIHCEFNPILRSGLMPDGTARLRHEGQSIRQLVGIGCFAEQVVTPQESIVRIRPDVPLDRAALMGCGVTTGIGAALFTAQVREGESVLVVGAGGVGLNVIQGAHLAGAYPIIVADLLPSKLEAARRFGASHTVNPREQDLLAVTRELTEGRGTDYGFEVIGLVETMQQVYAAIRKGGTFVIVGQTQAGAVFPLDPLMMLREGKTIKGAPYGSANLPVDIPRLLDLYVGGRLKLDELITQRYSLEEVNEAYEALERGDLLRGVIVLA